MGGYNCYCIYIKKAYLNKQLFPFFFYGIDLLCQKNNFFNQFKLFNDGRRTCTRDSDENSGKMLNLIR